METWTLSVVGKIVLIKLKLTVSFIFYELVSNLKYICREIDSTNRIFLENQLCNNSCKDHYSPIQAIAWNKIYTLKCGGLGIKKMEDINAAFPTK